MASTPLPAAAASAAFALAHGPGTSHGPAGAPLSSLPHMPGYNLGCGRLGGGLVVWLGAGRPWGGGRATSETAGRGGDGGTVPSIVSSTVVLKGRRGVARRKGPAAVRDRLGWAGRRGARALPARRASRDLSLSRLLKASGGAACALPQGAAPLA
jgi:hypothetical protein